VIDTEVADAIDEDLENLELVNAELASRLDRQGHSLSRIEAKAIVMLGFAATAIQFLATRDPFWTSWSILFGLVAFVAYIGSFAFGVWSLRVAKSRDLEPGELRRLATGRKADTLRQLIWARRTIFDTNKRTAQRKADAWRWSFVLLTAGLLSSVVCIMQTS
jgi:hypothetical protein